MGKLTDRRSERYALFFLPRFFQLQKVPRFGRGCAWEKDIKGGVGVLMSVGATASLPPNSSGSFRTTFE